MVKVSKGVLKYVEDMKDPRFFFSPEGSWNKVHGDGKASTKGFYLALSMATSDEPPKYLVKVESRGKHQVHIVIGPLELTPEPDNKPPLDADVLEVLRNAVGLE